MYRPPSGISGSFSKTKWGHYRCEDCEIACTSYNCLQQHLNGTRHIQRFFESSKEENPFPLEHMVVLDQTEEDLTNDNAASPASCDSSDSETAASVSVNIPRIVILDETNDDNDHPASPAYCDSSASESAPAAETVHGTSEKSTSKKSPAKSSKTRRKKSKTLHIEPVKSNKDVFQFMKTFAIASESDVAFSEKVKEMFSKALKRYEERKLEEILCTEAEHSSPEDLMESTDGSSNHEETNSSIPQATNKSECEIINSAPGSPANSSPTQCIINPTSTADYQQDSTIINQSTNSDPSSIASRSPTNIYEDMATSSKLSAINSTNDNPCSATEADLLSEDCVLAEAACSDDDDDDV